ncbi:DUF4296 domain-containing protein [Weeksellaceae bacterium TAE3-ERU29]|nr:DUF4296 domain-containing protein [Weeksellaceae bacterium TAE3-ERU29]
MKKIILFTFSLLTFLSCNREIERPDNLIKRDVFKSILAEMYVYKQIPASSDMNYKEQDNISISILKKHNIPIDQFKSSMEYYMVENTDYENILKEIQDSLQQLLPEGTQQEREELIMLNEELEID